tara:strand:- start:43867 stop:48873 length:5007 start_codon:yes stop_codon:yes gene_type:complete
MKSISMKQTYQINSQAIRIPHKRGGSTLLVVIALLAMLSLLGVIFYTFSSQEQRSAQYFTDASLNEADPGLDADVLFNWGLRQLIVGPDDSLYNSALYGKRHSLLPNMFGNDLHPFNGQGINVALNGSNVVVVDQNYTGSGASGDQNFLALNHSYGAHGGSQPPSWNTFPLPDVDYTSPDINNLFLAYDGYTLDGGNLRRVIIPSFLRPQFLRNSSSGVHLDDWYSNTNTTEMVLRPHPEHLFIAPDGSPVGTTKRFTSAFPFTPLANPSGNAAVNGELGIFTNSFNSGAPIVELDVDNDGDNLPEGIWMDLDFPPVQHPDDPTKYILPLFSFTVHDLDALINLNTAGNMRRPNNIDLNYSPSNNFFGEHSSIYTDKYLFLSRSNMGLSSPGEINPQWALNARPAKYTSGGDMVDSAAANGVLMQHRLFFGGFPYPYGGFAAPRSYASYSNYTDFQTAYEDTVAWREISNMEYFFLNFGRPEFSTPSPLDNGTKNNIVDLYPGRWGEPNLLYDSQRTNPGDLIYVLETDGMGNVQKTFPRAGQAMVDDNANRYEGGPLSGSLNGTPSNVQSFMHPLAYNGSGRINKTGGNYRQPSVGYNGWKGYRDFDIAGTIRYNSDPVFFKDSIANTSTAFGPLMDEADEITVDLEKVQRPYDEPFTADDLAFLHMSQTEQNNTGVSSRLEFLLPFNFGRESDINVRGESIRKQFTTMSWGRKQFSLPTTGTRTWETSNNFPPPFSGVDPFRPELRSLLTVIPGNTGNPQLQMKLNLNQLLVYDDTGTGRTVTTRPLTPHPGEDVNDNGTLDPGEDLNGNSQLDDLPSSKILYTTPGTNWDPYSSPVQMPSYPPVAENSMSLANNQEIWARYDRQRMARDIYVLLYTLGGGNDSTFYHTDSSPYTSTQMKEMAQFAVNMVDNLDPDDVITRFEYDTNLSNGWGLDDNPYTDEGGNRAEVFGVEAQKLTLSEFLAIKANKVTDASSNPVNHDATEYDDKKDRYFSFLELRNANHQPVSFANDAWQIRLEPRTISVSENYADLDNSGLTGDWLDDVATETEFDDSHKRRLTLRSGFVRGGGIFTIRSAGDNENTDPMTSMPRESYFRVDPNFSGGAPLFTTIAPQDTTTNPALDLITGNDTTDYRLTTEADTLTPIANKGDFLNDSNTVPMSGSANFNTLIFVVRLMRRAHLGRNPPAVNNDPDDKDNPWVEVDSMVVSGMNEFALSQMDMSTQIQGELNDLQSYERKQPLHARGGQAKHAAGNAGSSFRANSVGTINSKTRNKYKASDLPVLKGTDVATGISGVDDDNNGSVDDVEEAGWAFSDDRPSIDIWQPHFDRDFASVIELLSIPLVGPNRITRDLATETGKQTRTDTSTNVDKANDVRFAGIQKYLDPSGPDDSDATDNNRWYRLFEFVEVPTRAHRQLGNPLADPRVPGRINLNTLRHPAILAALLDDTDAFTMDMSISAKHPRLLANHLGGADWWEEFIKSRDAADTGLANAARIPGTPGSRPFRSFAANLPTSSNETLVRDLRENTILRSLPADGASSNPRLLFELANSAEHLGNGSAITGEFVDVHTRNRILSKIAGNTTNLSNTFVVFMSVAYFEATGTGTTTYGSPVQIGERLSPINSAWTANQPDYKGFFIIDRTRAEEAFESSTGQFDHWKRLIRYRHQIPQN